MSLLSRPPIARFVARRLQSAMPRMMAAQSGGDPRERLPEFAAERRDIVIDATPPAPAVIYRSPDAAERPGVHVNFHGGGYILGQTHGDDPLCRVIASRAGVVVIDVDYAVAPQHPFPAPVDQAFEVVRWVADNAAAQGWDAERLSVGGQSAGGAIAAAVARKAWQGGGPGIRLQVLHYPPLDLTVSATEKRSPLATPMLRPWMSEVFDTAYAPNPRHRADPLVSPASAADVTDLSGIAPAVVIAASDDILRDEDERYARRLERAGALIAFWEVAHADHGYDGSDDTLARDTYLRIAHHIRTAQGDDTAQG